MREEIVFLFLTFLCLSLSKESFCSAALATEESENPEPFEQDLTQDQNGETIQNQNLKDSNEIVQDRLPENQAVQRADLITVKKESQDLNLIRLAKPPPWDPLSTIGKPAATKPPYKVSFTPYTTPTPLPNRPDWTNKDWINYFRSNHPNFWFRDQLKKEHMRENNETLRKKNWNKNEQESDSYFPGFPSYTVVPGPNRHRISYINGPGHISVVSSPFLFNNKVKLKSTNPRIKKPQYLESQNASDLIINVYRKATDTNSLEEEENNYREHVEIPDLERKRRSPQDPVRDKYLFFLKNKPQNEEVIGENFDYGANYSPNDNHMGWSSTEWTQPRIKYVIPSQLLIRQSSMGPKASGMHDLIKDAPAPMLNMESSINTNIVDESTFLKRQQEQIQQQVFLLRLLQQAQQTERQQSPVTNVPPPYWYNPYPPYYQQPAAPGGASTSTSCSSSGCTSAAAAGSSTSTSSSSGPGSSRRQSANQRTSDTNRPKRTRASTTERPTERTTTTRRTTTATTTTSTPSSNQNDALSLNSRPNFNQAQNVTTVAPTTVASNSTSNSNNTRPFSFRIGKREAHDDDEEPYYDYENLQDNIEYNKFTEPVTVASPKIYETMKPSVIPPKPEDHKRYNLPNQPFIPKIVDDQIRHEQPPVTPQPHLAEYNKPQELVSQSQNGFRYEMPDVEEYDVGNDPLETPSSLQTILSSHQIKTNFLKTPPRTEHIGYQILPTDNKISNYQPTNMMTLLTPPDNYEPVPNHYQTIAERFYTTSGDNKIHHQHPPRPVSFAEDMAEDRLDTDEPEETQVDVAAEPKDSPLMSTAVIALKLSAKLLDFYKTVSPYLPS